MIIGVAGTFASGKDTVAHYLSTFGFEHFSTADEIRAEMVEVGIPVDRTHMQDYSTKQRAAHGNAYFTEKAMAKANGNAVFADMRHPDEIRALQKEPGFQLIIVDARVELRFERAKARNRIGDGETLEAFSEKENRELQGLSGGHQLGEVLAMGNYRIENDGTLEELHKKVDNVLKQIRNSNIETRNKS